MSSNEYDDALRDIVDKNYGVEPGDIDFFIRDPDVSSTAVPEGNPSAKPQLHSPISNTNRRNSMKSTPSVTEVVQSPSYTPRERKSSISSMSSSGSTGSSSGFFNKLKGKFSRSRSLSESNRMQNAMLPPSPVEADSSDIPEFRDFSFDKERSPILSDTDGESRLEQHIECFKRLGGDAKQPPKTISTYADNEIPVHPSRSPWPSALINCSEHDPIKPESKFSLLRRRTLTNETRTTPEPRDRRVPDERRKPLQRVGFASNTFLIDPPQQIPSRSPRKGNVTIENGNVKVRPLTDEERKQVEKSLLGQGGGIVVGGTGSLGTINKSDDDEEPVSETEIERPLEDDEPAVSDHAKNIAIDKPLIKPKPNYYQAPVEKMALDLMYTRCCHLREILPIPAVLKQIPKDSMSAIPILQMRNPAPSNIEILSFADFVRIAPIVCLSFDGVSLTLEQFRIILSAISAKTQLQKLSLRNTPIDPDGWRLLCVFLSRNRNLRKLDITQCPQLQINLLKKKKKSADELVRMKSNVENRSDMDWEIFIATIIARGGIDELILTGCCIQDVTHFRLLITRAATIRTSRLGLAFNNLDSERLRIITDHWMLSEPARGLDLGYNDFSDVQMLSPITNAIRAEEGQKLVATAPLGFFSLNSTNIIFGEPFKHLFDEFLLKLPNLKYFDLSNNQKLFSGDQKAVSEFCCQRLPMFPKLIRLHLEKNNLSQDSLLAFANVLPFCRNLAYVSLRGNQIDLGTAAALLQAVKNSSSIVYLDLDYESFPKYFKERLGLYTMRNIEQLLERSLGEKPAETDSLSSGLNALLSKKAEHKLDLNSDEVKTFIARAQNVKKQLRATIQELLAIQLQQDLDWDGKEALIRLIFMDSALTTGIQLINPKLGQSSLSEQQALKFAQQSSAEGDGRFQTRPDEGGEVVHMADDMAPPVSRSSSRTNLHSLDKEEGSYMKLGLLKQYHLPHYSGRIDDVSGEKLRQELNGVGLHDLDSAISFMQKLKDQGISLEDVYKRRCNNDLAETEQKQMAEIERRIRELAKREGIEEPQGTKCQSYPNEDYGEVVDDIYHNMIRKFAHETK